MMQTCPGCGLQGPTDPRPVEAHLDASPACHAHYRALLKRERSDLRYMAVHALTVDAYAVQHPVQDDDEAIRLLGSHLVSLYAQLVLDLPYRGARRFREQAAEALAFRYLPVPDGLGELTVAHALPAQTPEQHAERVTEWAWSCWRAWSPHHDQVMSWTRRLLGEIPRPRSRQPDGLPWLAGARNVILPSPERAESSDPAS